MSFSETLNERKAPSKLRRNNLLVVFTNRFGTPLTTGLFIVSAVSGTALFFHWAPGAFHSMHSWLSMVLLAPFGLHMWKNWRPLIGYARRGRLVWPLIGCLIASLPFAYSGMGGSGHSNPGSRMSALLTHAHLSDLAPVLKTSPDALLATLKQRGYRAESTEETLAVIAKASGKQPSEVLLAVMPK